MKASLSLKSVLVTTLFVFSSCATTKYSSEIEKNNYSNLLTGRTYSFKIKDSSLKQKMVFTRVTKDSIIGFANKKDSTIVSLAKSNVLEAKDTKKAGVNIGAIAIGTAAIVALIVSTSRTTK